MCVRESQCVCLCARVCARARAFLFCVGGGGGGGFAQHEQRKEISHNLDHARKSCVTKEYDKPSTKKCFLFFFDEPRLTH